MSLTRNTVPTDCGPASVGANQAGKASPVVIELNHLQRSQEMTSELLGDLIDRLETILTPKAPQGQPQLGAQVPQPVPASQLAARLADRAEHANELNSALRELMDRLTV